MRPVQDPFCIVEGASLDFGEVAVGARCPSDTANRSASLRRIVVFRNEGVRETLELALSRHEHWLRCCFENDGDLCALPPSQGGRARLFVELQPSHLPVASGELHGSVLIQTNDPTRPTVEINARLLLTVPESTLVDDDSSPSPAAGSVIPAEVQHTGRGAARSGTVSIPATPMDIPLRQDIVDSVSFLIVLLLVGCALWPTRLPFPDLRLKPQGNDHSHLPLKIKPMPDEFPWLDMGAPVFGDKRHWGQIPCDVPFPRDKDQMTLCIYEVRDLQKDDGGQYRALVRPWEITFNRAGAIVGTPIANAEKQVPLSRIGPPRPLTPKGQQDQPFPRSVLTLLWCVTVSLIKALPLGERWFTWGGKTAVTGIAVVVARMWAAWSPVPATDRLALFVCMALLLILLGTASNTWRAAMSSLLNVVIDRLVESRGESPNRSPHSPRFRDRFFAEWIERGGEHG